MNNNTLNGKLTENPREIAAFVGGAEKKPMTGKQIIIKLPEGFQWPEDSGIEKIVVIIDGVEYVATKPGKETGEESRETGD
jgi:hypothetical protein